MAPNKPRGSQKGLLKNRADTKQKNTEAMQEVLEELKKLKPSETWTYREIWQQAGLKSDVALSCVWNRHIKSAIDDHNRSVKNLRVTQQSQQKRELTLVEKLTGQIKDLEEQLRKALSTVALHQADTEYYKDQYDKLNQRYKRLKGISMATTKPFRTNIT